MNFNLKKTLIYQAIRWDKLKYAKLSFFLFFLVFLISFGFFVFLTFSTEDVITTTFLKENIKIRQTVGLSIVSLFFTILFFELNLFWSYLRNPKKDSSNLASMLDLESAKIVKQALKQNHSLLYYLLKSDAKDLQFVFQRGQLNIGLLKNLLKKESVRTNITEVIKESLKTAKGYVTTGDILISLAEKDPLFQKFLIESDFKTRDIENLVFWRRKTKRRKEKMKRWWTKENLSQKGSLFRDWTSNFSVNLDKYSLDLREGLKKNNQREIIGHKEEIAQVERVLEKESLNNVLLVGEDGTGRYSIIESIAQRAFFGISSEGINYKRVLDLDIGLIVSTTKSQDEVEEELEKCFCETLKAGNIILVVRDIHKFLSKDPIPGTVNISGVLSRYLEYSTFQIIGITTYQDFHSIIERNTSFASSFEKVEVSEISDRETLELMQDNVPFFEAKHKRAIGYRALKEILKLSSKYFAQSPFPEKAMKLLDESVAYLTVHTKDKILEPHHITKVVSEKTDIPLENLAEKEKGLLLNLEEQIHKRLVNQEEAVEAVSNALRRARAEVNTRTGPMGSFLFLGPTGVGKTELSKILADIYFGSEKRIIRFDMSEFQNLVDIHRLLGTREENGLLTTKVKEDPFSLVLLDELEKAHKNILNLFLQVLDEGWVTDGLGRKIDFKSTIIIATSNAGSSLIREDVKIGRDNAEIKERLLTYLTEKGIYRPEFINRFDSVVCFKPLTKDNLLKIVHLMLKKLQQNLLDKGVKFEITLELKEKIVEMSYDPRFGAREMTRVIQTEVENVLAKALLSGQLKRGKRVKVDQNFNLNIL